MLSRINQNDIKTKKIIFIDFFIVYSFSSCFSGCSYLKNIQAKKRQHNGKNQCLLFA
jgi:hypothetical protein